MTAELIYRRLCEKCRGTGEISFEGKSGRQMFDQCFDCASTGWASEIRLDPNRTLTVRGFVEVFTAEDSFASGFGQAEIVVQDILEVFNRDTP